MLLIFPGRHPAFPPTDQLPPGRGEVGLVALGGDLSEATLLEAYSKGLFPWEGRHPLPWCSPDPRAILIPGEFRASRSLKKLARQGRYAITFNTAFTAVMKACASIARPGQSGTWITPRMIKAYTRLHRMGVAQSVEVWPADEVGRTLVGGLYGIRMGQAFFGESMFARAPNVSKLALQAWCARLDSEGVQLIDCQQDTDHLRSLGSMTISRQAFIERIRAAGVVERH
ncbi:MAG: leucyl/phenylalanyl-tRNA--protein transferase [Bradymonadia bacterium]